MNDNEDRSGPSKDPHKDSKEPRQFSSNDLFKGARELIINHGNDQYRLRVTMSDKLILTK